MKKHDIKYFTKFPNKFIHCNIADEGLHRIFYVMYILIDIHHSYCYDSWISIKKVFDTCGYKYSKKKTGIYSNVLDVLRYMIETDMIECLTDLNTVSFDTCIELHIKPDIYYPKNNFTMIDRGIFETIMSYSSTISNENILLTYLYISSYIYVKYEEEDPTPAAFYRDIKKSASVIGLSYHTMNNCLNALIDMELLIKYETSSIILDNGVKHKLPNIYVHNKCNYEEEIRRTEKFLLKLIKKIKFMVDK